MIKSVNFLEREKRKILISKRLTTSIVIVLIFISTSRLLFNILSNLDNNMLDFGTYYYGIQNLLHNVNPYTFKPRMPVEGGIYVYPPSSFIMFFPFSFFSLTVNKIIFTFLSLFCFWMIFWLLKKMISGKIQNSHFFLLMLFLTETYSVKSNFLFGQMNIVILFLIITSLYFYRKSLLATSEKMLRKNKCFIGKKKLYIFLSIVFFTLGAAIKIIPLFLLPLFILKKDWIYSLTVIFFFIALNLVVSPNLSKIYVARTLQYHSLASYPSIIDISVPAFVMRLTNNLFISKLLQYIFLISMYATTIFIMRKRLSIPSIVRKFSTDTFISFLFANIFVLSFITISFTPAWRQYILYSYPLLFLVLISFLKNKKYISRHALKFFSIVIILWLALDFHFDEWTTYPISPIILTYQTIIVLGLEFYSIFFIFKNTKISHNKNTPKNP